MTTPDWITISPMTWSNSPATEVTCARCGMTLIVPEVCAQQNPRTVDDWIEEHQHCKETGKAA